MVHKQLTKARSKKKDDFYTSISDIENELKYYTSHFKNKVVLCNCDDPRVSNFFHYFAYNFERLKLKKLISVCYKNQNLEMFTNSKSEQAIYIEYTGDKNGNRVPDLEEIEVISLKGDGDFRSLECIKLLEEADIVVTNPPFSLFREYIKQLMEYKKKFIIIGTMNVITYKEVFPLIKDNKIWMGINNNQSCVFKTPYINTLEDNKKFCEQKGYVGDNFVKVPGINWYTNLLHKKRNEELILVKTYKGNEKDYPKYDNYDAIEVSKVTKIPKDYYGCMGVPITFLDKYNSNQFEIVKFRKGDDGKDLSINGKYPYFRILIKRTN